MATGGADKPTKPSYSERRIPSLLDLSNKEKGMLTTTSGSQLLVKDKSSVSGGASSKSTSMSMQFLSVSESPSTPLRKRTASVSVPERGKPFELKDITSDLQVICSHIICFAEFESGSSDWDYKGFWEHFLLECDHDYGCLPRILEFLERIAKKGEIHRTRARDLLRETVNGHELSYWIVEDEEDFKEFFIDMTEDSKFKHSREMFTLIEDVYQLFQDIINAISNLDEKVNIEIKPLVMSKDIPRQLELRDIIRFGKLAFTFIPIADVNMVKLSIQNAVIGILPCMELLDLNGDGLTTNWFAYASESGTLHSLVTSLASLRNLCSGDIEYKAKKLFENSICGVPLEVWSDCRKKSPKKVLADRINAENAACSIRNICFEALSLLNQLFISDVTEPRLISPTWYDTQIGKMFCAAVNASCSESASIAIEKVCKEISVNKEAFHSQKAKKPIVNIVDRFKESVEENNAVKQLERQSRSREKGKSEQRSKSLSDAKNPIIDKHTRSSSASRGKDNIVSVSPEPPRWDLVLEQSKNKWKKWKAPRCELTDLEISRWLSDVKTTESKAKLIGIAINVGRKSGEDILKEDYSALRFLANYDQLIRPGTIKEGKNDDSWMAGKLLLLTTAISCVAKDGLPEHKAKAKKLLFQEIYGITFKAWATHETHGKDKLSSIKDDQIYSQVIKQLLYSIWCGTQFLLEIEDSYVDKHEIIKEHMDKSKEHLATIKSKPTKALSNREDPRMKAIPTPNIPKSTAE